MPPSQSARSACSPSDSPPASAICALSVAGDRKGTDCRPLLIAILKRLEKIEELLHGTAKDYFTVAEAASLLGRSAYTVRRHVAKKRLSAQRAIGTGPKGRLLILAIRRCRSSRARPKCPRSFEPEGRMPQSPIAPNPANRRRPRIVRKRHGLATKDERIMKFKTCYSLKGFYVDRNAIVLEAYRSQQYVERDQTRSLVVQHIERFSLARGDWSSTRRGT